MQGPTSAPTGDGEHCYTTVACNSSHGMNQHELKTAEYQRLDPKPGNMLIRIACEIAELRATLVWRAPEGPEGTGGLRDRPLRAFRLACGDLAGGRARRRPEHQRSRKQQAQSRIPAAPPAWRAPEGARGPGCGARGRRGPAAVPVGGGRARAGLKTTHPATRQRHITAGMEGAGGRKRAWPRCRWAAAGPGRASRSTTPSRQARVWRSRGRAAAHRHTQRPGPQAAQERCAA